MVDLFIALLLAFIAGFIVKSVDWIDDEKQGRYIIKWPLAIIYGGIIGYLISQASFSAIFLAALFAQLFARKIDTHTHVLGFAFALLSLFYLGFPDFELTLFLFFALLAFMDEMQYFGRMHWIMEYRPFLKAGALVMVLFGRIDYFIAIIAFDFGYALFDFSQKRIFKLE